MPSQAMKSVIAGVRKARDSRAGQAPRTLAERRADFAPGGAIYPIPDDVQVTDMVAGGVQAHWIVAPGVDTGRVLLFVHGGGYALRSFTRLGQLPPPLPPTIRVRLLSLHI